MKLHHNSRKPEEAIVSNLKALGFDPLIHCKNKNLIIDKYTFTKRQNSIKAFEIITYFLFNLLDKTRTKKLFKDILPITSKKDSLVYRNRAFAWLMEIRSGTPLESVSLRKSYLIDCRGENVNKIIMAFSTLVLRTIESRKNPVGTSHKELNKNVIEKENIISSEQLKDFRLKSNASRKRWNDDGADLLSQTEHKKRNIQPRRSEVVPNRSLLRSKLSEVYRRPTNYPSLLHASNKKPTNAKEVYKQVSSSLKQSIKPKSNLIIPQSLPRKHTPLSPSSSTPIKEKSSNSRQTICVSPIRTSEQMISDYESIFLENLSSPADDDSYSPPSTGVPILPIKVPESMRVGF